MPTKTSKKKICPICKKSKSISAGFYKSTSPLYQEDGCVPICISCVKEDVTNADGTINKSKFKTMLQRLDKPLYWDDLESAYAQYRREHSYLTDDEVTKQGKDIIGLYFKNIMLRQNRDKSFADSEKDNFIHVNSNTTKSELDRINKKYSGDGDIVIDIYKDRINDKNTKPNPTSAFQKKEEPVILANDDNFKVTPEIIDLFGEGYTTSMYKKMQEKYDKLKINYTLQTNIHQEALATYVRFKVQEELATARGDVTEAKKWYDAAQSSAQDAKLTPKQLTKADLDSGVTSMSELTKALEQAVDVIKILPRFKYRPNDAVDFNIWCYVNYERRLNGQPEVAYEDVYKFYDEKKKQYIEQNGDPYGIFSNDTTEKNRDTVKTFIKLPDDYDDLGGEDNENT